MFPTAYEAEVTVWIDHLPLVIDMNEAKLATIEQTREFLAGAAVLTFTVPTEDAKRRLFVVTVLRRFGYFRLGKAHLGVLFAYMQCLTGYSWRHLRLVAQYRRTKSLRPGDRTSRTSFARKYGRADGALLPAASHQERDFLRCVGGW